MLARYCTAVVIIEMKRCCGLVGRLRAFVAAKMGSSPILRRTAKDGESPRGAAKEGNQSASHGNTII